MLKIDIYTDGACKGNPGVGGFGALLIFGQKQKELCGGDLHTTNQKMELLAAIKALQALKKPCIVNLYSDSKYLVQGMNEWLANWKKSNFKNNTIKNIELWRVLDDLNQYHQINWSWVKGHSSNAGNKRADELANLGVQQILEQNKCA